MGILSKIDNLITNSSNYRYAEAIIVSTETLIKLHQELYDCFGLIDINTYASIDIKTSNKILPDEAVLLIRKHNTYLLV